MKTRLTPFAKIVIIILVLGGLFAVFKVVNLDKKISDYTNTDDASKQISDNADDYIAILSGSNSIGDKLAAQVLKSFLEKQGKAEVTIVHIDAENKVIEYMDDKDKKKILIRAHGTTTGFTELAENQKVVVMSSRQIKPEEASKLSQFGDLTSSQSEFVIGLDGVAIITGQNNPIKKLDKKVISKIFAGEIKDWSEISTTMKGTIRIYARDENSGTFDSFKNLVLLTKQLSGEAVRISDSKELVDKVVSDDQGIGFVSMAYISGLKTVAVSDGTENAFYPTKLTVSTEDYPLTRKLYLYVLLTKQSDLIKDFIKYVISADGQRIVGENGFVEFKTEEMADKAYPVLPKTAKRLSINFRFKSGSLELDNKALIDIGRLAEKKELTNAEIYLVGFADSQGDTNSNKELSRKRAEAVKLELQSVGLKVTQIFGLGKEFPLAGNDNEEGRHKNRRVEIWINK